MKFLLKRAFTMDKARLRGVAERVSAETGRALWRVYLDIVWCGAIHGAGYNDYGLFELWRKNEHTRRTILTRGRNNRLVATLNDRQLIHIFDQKPEFNALFKPFIKREWLLPTDPDELRSFGERVGRFAAKPRDGSHGDDVELFNASDITDWEELYNRLASRLFEAAIVQDAELNRLCSASVNTVRMVTITASNHRPTLVAAYLRVGGGTRPVDNFNGGGMVTVVNKENGVVLCPAIDKAGNVYEAHPVTGTAFEGFQLPMWEAAVAMALSAAFVMPEVRYVGWDVAFTPDGPVLVEGNSYPGHDIYGLGPHSTDGCGVLPQFRAAARR